MAKTESDALYTVDIKSLPTPVKTTVFVVVVVVL